jgi:hydrogenase maturation factor
MCLGIPMQIVAIDYVIVHVGYAIQKVTEQEARSTWELLDEMLIAETGGQNHSTED